MKLTLLAILLLVLTSAVSGCADNSTPASTAAPAEPPVVEDKASLIAALQGGSATIEIADTITQDFFSVEGQIIRINGMDVQVFEYESPEAMENEAAQVAPDGGSVGNSMVSWIDSPHFFKAGRILVLYVGSDQTVLDLLEKVLGPQFAGQ